MKSKFLSRCREMGDFSWKDVLSGRNEIYGFVAVWIVLFHIHDFIGMPGFRGASLIRSILAVGNCGVDVFLFLSAVGLYGSMGKRSLGQFYRNRLLRICLPYLLAAVPYFAWYDFVFAKDGFWQFLANVTTVNFWLDPKYPIWYMSFILVVYGLFPFIYKADVKTKHLSTVFLIVLSVAIEYILYATDSWFYDTSRRALARIPVFLLGVILAPRVLKGGKIPGGWVIGACFAGIGVYYLVTFHEMPLMYIWHSYALLAVSGIVVFAYVKKLLPLEPVYAVLRWLGGISFEIYAVHVLLVKGINHVSLWDRIGNVFVWYILVLAVSVPLAKLVALVSARVNKRLVRL